MANIHLTVALSDYDHFRDFTGGKIKAEGIDITHIDLPVEEIFYRFAQFREWHVSEAFDVRINRRARPEPNLAER